MVPQKVNLEEKILLLYLLPTNGFVVYATNVIPEGSDAERSITAQT